MKTKLILLCIGIFSIIGCSTAKKEQSFKQDQFDAINDFLETQIKDTTKKIIIIKEKININETIELFHGEYLSISYPDTIYTQREGGVSFPLYNQKDWLKMKIKYGNKKEIIFGDSGYWNENNFNYKRIDFEKGIEFWNKVYRLEVGKQN